MVEILRPKHLCAALAVGQTMLWDYYIYRPTIGGEQFVPGTNVPKLKLTKIGPRAVGAFTDEVATLIEALRADRDAKIAAGPATEPPRKRDAAPKRHHHAARHRKAA